MRTGRPFSGFGREHWSQRCNEFHAGYAKKARMAASGAKLEKQVVQYGCCYSARLELEHFDAIHFTVTDPEQNLFLCFAK